MLSNILPRKVKNQFDIQKREQELIAIFVLDLTYCHGNNDVVSARSALAAHMAFLHLVLSVASCEASYTVDANLLAVVADVFQPLLPRSSYWTTTVCVFMQKQMCIAVISHAGHMAEICQSACQSIFVQPN